MHEQYVSLNHSKGEYSRGVYSTSRLDNFWMMLKRAVMAQNHRITTKNLQLYLDELSLKKSSIKDETCSS